MIITINRILAVLKWWGNQWKRNKIQILIQFFFQRNDTTTRLLTSRLVQFNSTVLMMSLYEEKRTVGMSACVPAYL